MEKNKLGGESIPASDPRLIERGTAEYFARRLESHIKYFKPASWRGPIREFMAPPYISVEDWSAYQKGFTERKLTEAMESRPVSSGQPRWMIREAIEDFFKQGKHNEK